MQTNANEKIARMMLYKTYYACSECKYGTPAPIWNYCPNCGARFVSREEYERIKARKDND